jgi:hypothetical protein
MANATVGKWWLLDSTGLVWGPSVFVKNVQITWKVASAGTVELAEYNVCDGVMASFLYAQTLGATSAAVDQMTQVIEIDNVIQGLYVKTIANVAKLIVNVK